MARRKKSLLSFNDVCSNDAENNSKEDTLSVTENEITIEIPNNNINVNNNESAIESNITDYNTSFVNNPNTNKNANTTANQSSKITNFNNKIIDTIIRGEKQEKEEKTFVGFYLDPEVNAILNHLSAKATGRGVKSKIANESLREVFELRGLIGKG